MLRQLPQYQHWLAPVLIVTFLPLLDALHFVVRSTSAYEMTSQKEDEEGATTFD